MRAGTDYRELSRDPYVKYRDKKPRIEPRGRRQRMNPGFGGNQQGMAFNPMMMRLEPPQPGQELSLQSRLSNDPFFNTPWMTGGVVGARRHARDQRWGRMEGAYQGNRDRNMALERYYGRFPDELDRGVQMNQAASELPVLPMSTPDSAIGRMGNPLDEMIRLYSEIARTAGPQTNMQPGRQDPRYRGWEERYNPTGNVGGLGLY